MNREQLYMAGWRIAFAYLSGLSDGGNPAGADAYKSFPDTYAVHYRDQSLSPMPNLLEISLAFKQWRFMQTMAPTQKTFNLTPCEVTGD